MITLHMSLRKLNYSIREFPDSYFVLSILELETMQKWSVCVPITEVTTNMDGHVYFSLIGTTAGDRI